MTIKEMKYIVTIEGLDKPMEYKKYRDAVQDISVFMPCKAIIEAKEV